MSISCGKVARRGTVTRVWAPLWPVMEFGKYVCLTLLGHACVIIVPLTLIQKKKNSFFFSVFRWQLGIRLQNICKNKKTNRGTTIKQTQAETLSCLRFAVDWRRHKKSTEWASQELNLEALIHSQRRYPWHHWPISFYILCFLFCFGRGKGLNLYLLFVHFIERPESGQPFPGSLVVKIWRSHRRGPG